MVEIPGNCPPHIIRSPGSLSYGPGIFFRFLINKFPPLNLIDPKSQLPDAFEIFRSLRQINDLMIPYSRYNHVTQKLSPHTLCFPHPYCSHCIRMHEHSGNYRTRILRTEEVQLNCRNRAVSQRFGGSGPAGWLLPYDGSHDVPRRASERP